MCSQVSTEFVKFINPRPRFSSQPGSLTFFWDVVNSFNCTRDNALLMALSILWGWGGSCIKFVAFVLQKVTTGRVINLLLLARIGSEFCRPESSRQNPVDNWILRQKSHHKSDVKLPSTAKLSRVRMFIVGRGRCEDVCSWELSMVKVKAMKSIPIRSAVNVSIAIECWNLQVASLRVSILFSNFLRQARNTLSVS